MLGWSVFVFREKPDFLNSESLACWETSVFGLQWLKDLVKAGKALDLGGNGYPNRYCIPAGLFRSILSDGLPHNQSPIVIGDDYLLPAGWNGKLEVDSALLASCPAEEPLVIEAWDMS